MTKLAAAGPNAEQIEYWNEQSGPKWVRFEALLDAQIEPLGLAAMDAAGVSPGERVLDVGCGCGQSALELARRVGPGGGVLGVDLSAVMLERARERAREAGLHWLCFEDADAQTHDFPGNASLLFSRFGVMFFADPTQAFANLRRALAPGGRLAFVCWQGLAENAWIREPLMAALPLLETPPTPPPPGAPGPFAFADPERVRGILGAAGFEDVALESLERELLVGGTRSVEDSVDFLLQMGPLGRVLQDSDEAVLARVREAVLAEVAPRAGSDGLRMGSKSWIVTARRGA